MNVNLLTLNSSSLASYNHWSSFTLPTCPYVLSLMVSLKSNSPLDPIPLTLLRTLSPSLIEPIIMIIHASLITSIVPKSMKHSYITPIIKKLPLATRTCRAIDTSPRFQQSLRPWSELYLLNLYTISLPIQLLISCKVLTYLIGALNQHWILSLMIYSYPLTTKPRATLYYLTYPVPLTL